jgi:hypothetical protein
MCKRQNAELTRLEESLDHIRAAPADGGTVELIAWRPAVDEREVLDLSQTNLPPAPGFRSGRR